MAEINKKRAALLALLAEDTCSPAEAMLTITTAYYVVYLGGSDEVKRTDTGRCSDVAEEIIAEKETP